MARPRWRRRDGKPFLLATRLSLMKPGRAQEPRLACERYHTVVVVVVVMLMAPNSKLKSKGRCAVNACNIACAAVARFILVCALP